MIKKNYIHIHGNSFYIRPYNLFFRTKIYFDAISLLFSSFTFSFNVSNYASKYLHLELYLLIPYLPNNWTMFNSNISRQTFQVWIFPHYLDFEVWNFMVFNLLGSNTMKSFFFISIIFFSWFLTTKPFVNSS